MASEPEGFDETTDVRGLHEDQSKVVTAETALQETRDLVREYRGLTRIIQTMHEENHYTPRLRALFRGDANVGNRRAAS